MRRLLRPAIALLVIAFATRVDPVLGVVAVAAGWAATSWYLPGWALAGVEGSRHLPERALHGEQVESRLTISSSRGMSWLAVTDAMPFDLGPGTRWVTSFEPGGSQQHAVTFEATSRGLHSIGPAIAVTGDLFGLRRVQRVVVERQSILVYPRIVTIETLSLAAGAPLPVVPTRTPLFEDPTRIVGVRDYQPGDPFRKIHWTASASAGSLLVKQHRHGIAREVVVAVDLDRASHPSPGRRRSAEIAVTTAASICHHLATVEDEAVGLRLIGRDAPTGEVTLSEESPGRDAARLARMLESLARIGLAPDAPVDALLDASGLPFGGSFVLVTGNLTDRHATACVRLRRVGLAVTVVTTSGPRHASDWASTLRDHGVTVNDVSGLPDLVAL